jgi:hypothetical protein
MRPASANNERVNKGWWNKESIGRKQGRTCVGDYSNKKLLIVTRRMY